MYTLFVPRVKEGPLSVLRFCFMYNIWQMPGFEPELLRPQPGVPPMSYTFHPNFSIMRQCRLCRQYTSRRKLTKSPAASQSSEDYQNKFISGAQLCNKAGEMNKYLEISSTTLHQSRRNEQISRDKFNYFAPKQEK